MALDAAVDCDSAVVFDEPFVHPAVLFPVQPVDVQPVPGKNSLPSVGPSVAAVPLIAIPTDGVLSPTPSEATVSADTGVVPSRDALTVVSAALLVCNAEMLDDVSATT